MYNAQNLLISALSGYLACGRSILNWDDSQTPRTERPVRFQFRETLAQPMRRVKVCDACGAAVCPGCIYPLV